jgi:hypothetical protein
MKELKSYETTPNPTPKKKTSKEQEGIYFSITLPVFTIFQRTTPYAQYL